MCRRFFVIFKDNLFLAPSTNCNLIGEHVGHFLSLTDFD